ncbi:MULTISPECIES: ABC transporter ATP-binding protein [unclassified Paenibacillus]|uniref:ABC transporter ATP-binding protein n=1 Tax=unclassified Paenibacillus TaxID=185978 RepID=UPI002404BAC5|nr:MULTISPECIES: ABC transporter ATP-binding protein [unclassified Paenibacillus]MDF9839184.1 putative ABC transport system ATP-binding protein [Paenibacillus sp. PastF-2]MDF9845766.1 putative ABC transport system ATP-binding protein [Paenibacillus sp. PastM-2]MDF9852338.1 putative ABC transport system ATP-binding protein [Paenibacillus sp. PastF-1]MDH6477932.1 putative ABC transport system ATP-binding protein [Paenibacillus sp. PastH-2]MDH6505670.1 putative ABC transport system ATP-binding pr
MSAMLMMKQVTQTYGDGGQTMSVLDNLDLTVHVGEFVAVLGPSGSGKSTFLSAAGALLTPTSGEIYIDGESLNNKDKKELTALRLQKIGFMFQSAQLLPYLKVEEQLLYVARLAKLEPKEAKLRAAHLMQRLGIWDRRSHYPEKLSGGEKQRVAIARAWMNKPAILFADEPTASLDFERGREVVRMIADEVRSEGKAAVMVTHDERMLEWCSRVLHLENGALVEHK